MLKLPPEIYGDSCGRIGIGETPEELIGVQRLRTPHPVTNAFVTNILFSRGLPAARSKIDTATVTSSRCLPVLESNSAVYFQGGFDALIKCSNLPLLETQLSQTRHLIQLSLCRSRC